MIKAREYRSGNQIWTCQRNTGYTRRKKKHNTICIRNHYTETNTNNVNKTYDLLQTTGGKEESNIVFMLVNYLLISSLDSILYQTVIQFCQSAWQTRLYMLLFCNITGHHQQYTYLVSTAPDIVNRIVSVMVNVLASNRM